MASPRLDTKHALAWRIVATFALLTTAVYLLASHRQTVSRSLAAMRHASLLWLLMALALMAVTLGIASVIYGVLALHRLRLRDTLLIQLAASFVGRLLPAGLGGLGLNGVYLYRRRHTPAEATAVVSVNNLIGMVAHLLLLACMIVVRPSALQSLVHRHSLSVPVPVVGACILGLAVLLTLPPVRRQLLRFAANLLVSLRKERVHTLFTALALSALLTTTYTALLFSSMRAVGVHLGPAQVFIVFSLGMLVGTVTPTPGGLVGVEAGLFAGFTAFGVPGVQAGAAVLIFRLVSYWLPLVPGALALLQARRLRLV